MWRTPSPTTRTRIDGARLLAQKAAWALDCSDVRRRELAAMAFAFASETAEGATYDAVHVHGGYGFMLEHDVQLYYRRAGVGPGLGDAEAAYRRAAEARYDTHHRAGPLMDFAWDATAEGLRKEVRVFLSQHLTPDLEERIYTTGVSHDGGFARALGERNWIAPEWPREGFEALDPFEVHVLTDELTRAEAPIVAISTSMMVAKVIRAVGSETLRSEILPGVVAR